MIGLELDLLGGGPKVSATYSTPTEALGKILERLEEKLRDPRLDPDVAKRVAATIADLEALLEARAYCEFVILGDGDPGDAPESGDVARAIRRTRRVHR